MNVHERPAEQIDPEEQLKIQFGDKVFAMRPLGQRHTMWQGLVRDVSHELTLPLLGTPFAVRPHVHHHESAITLVSYPVVVLEAQNLERMEIKEGAVFWKDVVRFGHEELRAEFQKRSEEKIARAKASTVARFRNSGKTIYYFIETTLPVGDFGRTSHVAVAYQQVSEPTPLS